MNYSAYYPTDVLNGEGIRAVLFVSGCDHMCPGCYNQSTWSTSSGQPFTEEMEDQIISDLLDTRINRQGLTLTGGDPLHANNLSSVLHLVDRVKVECPGKDIWLWTGYTRREIDFGSLEPGEEGMRRLIISYVDVLVDGKFVQELHDPSLKFRGSSNQNIINLREERNNLIAIRTLYE